MLECEVLWCEALCEYAPYKMFSNTQNFLVHDTCCISNCLLQTEIAVSLFLFIN